MKANYQIWAVGDAVAQTIVVKSDVGLILVNMTIVWLKSVWAGLYIKSLRRVLAIRLHSLQHRLVTEVCEED